VFTGATGRPERDRGSERKPEDWSTAVAMKLEVVVVPVSDVDRAKDFYHALGW
jgi:hypothetical protein